jgi:hypothetical protein
VGICRFDGLMLAAGSEFTGFGAAVSFWQVLDEKFLQASRQETGYGARSLTFAPDGWLFAYGRVDVTVVVARNPFAMSLRLTNAAQRPIVAPEQ